MFPRSFKAQVAQRMAIWAAMLGFLAFLYAATETIQAWKMATIASDMQRATAMAGAHAEADAALARLVGAAGDTRGPKVAEDLEIVATALATAADPALDDDLRKVAGEAKGRLDALKASFAGSDTAAAGKTLSAFMEKRAELGKAAVGAIDGIRSREAYLLANNRQNKLLIALLALFVLGQILFLEYRWLVVPVVRMAAVLRAGENAPRQLGPDALRRDEIGALAQALTSHFGLVHRQQQAASEEQARLSERIARQDAFKRESIAFQQRIAEIVQNLEGHAGHMSTASEDLASLSSQVDARAGASAQSTERASHHVDVVASSIRDIAASVTSVAQEAEKTSAVAAAARELVQSASADAKALTEAARTIEQVIALIEDVANQTNLLALNATIEAARAGEMGRGFGVVASEVKQLATRTSRATEEVRGGLEGITSASTRIAERVAKLVGSIEEVDAVAAMIATSMREQDTNSQAITSNTAKTAEDVREVADAVKQVAGMIGEAKQAADMVTQVSTDLGQQAADLKVAVGRFVETTQGIAA